MIGKITGHYDPNNDLDDPPEFYQWEIKLKTAYLISAYVYQSKGAALKSLKHHAKKFGIKISKINYRRSYNSDRLF